MKDLTPEQIRARLAEVKDAENLHQARDFDAELKEVMLAGGDVDALESRQLDAERAARRLRVERQALEAALPDAERVAAQRELATLARSMIGHVKQFRDAAQALLQLKEQQARHEAVIARITQERAQAFDHAELLRVKHSLDRDVTQPFRHLVSGRLIAALTTPAPEGTSKPVYASWEFFGSKTDVDTEVA